MKNNFLKKYKGWMLMICAVAAVSMAGCGSSSSDEAEPEITATPIPTALPTQAPATTTPLPTSTPAPRVIGVKTTEAKFIYLTNKSSLELREIYLESSNLEEDDWGKNLIPSESSVKAAEQVQMYYTPDSGEDAAYNMKFVDSNGSVYEIYGADLSDMEKASLMIENDSAYLTYVSLSSKSETSTNGMLTSDNTDEESSDESTDENSDSSSDSTDDGSYDSSYDSSYDNNYDSSYDENYDNSYDDSYDNGEDYSEDNGGGEDYSEDYDSDYSGDDGDGVVWDEEGNWN